MKHILFSGLISFLLCSELLAAPTLQLCVDVDCRSLQSYKISEAAWQKVTALYSSPVQSITEEQDCLATSIRIIEDDVFQALARHDDRYANAQEAYLENSQKTSYRNIKHMISVLMDHHLVHQHVLRHTVFQREWHGARTIRGLLLQSMGNAQLYVVSKDTESLEAPVKITPYKDYPEDRLPIASDAKLDAAAKKEKDLE